MTPGTLQPCSTHFTNGNLNYFQWKAGLALGHASAADNYALLVAHSARGREIHRAEGYVLQKAGLAKGLAKKNSMSISLLERLEQKKLEGKACGTGRGPTGARRMVS